MYEPGTGTSRACNNLTQVNRQTTMEYYDDNIYIFGGEKGTADYMNTIWIFETPGAAASEETASNFTLSGYDGNNRITWSGEGGETVWSNATSYGTLTVNLTVNATDNITEMRLYIDDLGGAIDANNITVYVSSDNSNFAVVEHNPGGNGNGVPATNGGNISINTTTWPDSGAGSDPFPITNKTDFIYFRFTLSIPASETSSTTYTQDDWMDYYKSEV